MRQIFLKAARLVEKGWIQGAYYYNGCYCMHGAVACAATSSVTSSASDLLINAGYDVGWNDEPDRDKHEVVAVLLEFAEACK